MHNTRRFLCLVLVGFWTLTAAADVTPHALFSDNMVLQQEMNVPVWGTADDGREGHRPFQGQTVSTRADGGKWSVSLEPLNAGGPAEMTIQGKNTITLKNVLVGEVWVCRGQSNMAMTLGRMPRRRSRRSPNRPIPSIRLFTVPRKGADEPQADVDGAWSRVRPGHGGRLLRRRLLLRQASSREARRAGRADQLLLRRHAGRGVDQPPDAGLEAARSSRSSTATPRPSSDYPEAMKRLRSRAGKWKEAAAAARRKARSRNAAPQPPMGPEPSQAAGRPVQRHDLPLAALRHPRGHLVPGRGATPAGPTSTARSCRR